MKCKNYLDTNIECKQCPHSKKVEFKYIDSKKGVRTGFTCEKAYTLIFVLSGEVTISCNELANTTFRTKEICLLPISAHCAWETKENTTAIVVFGNDDNNYCDTVSLKQHGGSWLNTEEKFGKLKIKPRLLEFLHTIKKYLQDEINCPQLYETKQKELAMLFRIYYPHEDIIEFFLPIIKYNHDFELFIMENYLKMKGVKEFVDLSGLNVNTFNRKFKAHFGMSPYQWMIKQKSKHILHSLKTSDKSIADIMREFEFSDASHFNRYCKNVFGETPSDIRKNGKR